jgi:glycosyltransferase involved in cell wall biosynthesis
MSEPQVSVVLPTQNRWPMLSQALRSVLEQEGVELEAIVVDDGSSDETPDRLGQIDDPRLVVIRHETPTGVARARNEAIERARGRWVAFLDDDDLLAPDNFRVQLAHTDDPRVVLLYSGRVEVDGTLAVQHQTLGRPADDLAPRLLDVNVVGPPSGVLVRADALDRVGGFDETLSAMADWDLWIRLSQVGPAAVSPEPLLAYRRHAGSMTVAKADEVIGEFERLRDKHEAAAAARGVEFGAGFLPYWQPTRDFAEGHRLKAARGWARKAVRDRSLRDVARAGVVLGGKPLERLSRAAEGRRTPRPDWLERYA